MITIIAKKYHADIIMSEPIKKLIEETNPTDIITPEKNGTFVMKDVSKKNLFALMHNVKATHAREVRDLTKSQDTDANYSWRLNNLIAIYNKLKPNVLNLI